MALSRYSVGGDPAGKTGLQIVDDAHAQGDARLPRGAAEMGSARVGRCPSARAGADSRGRWTSIQGPVGCLLKLAGNVRKGAALKF